MGNSIFVFDAGPLITACKFDAGGQLVIDHISERCEIVVAASVQDEVIVAGARYPPAFVEHTLLLLRR